MLYAKTVYSALKTAGIRVTLADDNDSMGKKIRAAKNDKLPYFIVIGDKEVADKTVTLEKRDGTKQVIDITELTSLLTKEVADKTL